MQALSRVVEAEQPELDDSSFVHESISGVLIERTDKRPLGESKCDKAESVQF
jgi:hypothetical protein